MRYADMYTCRACLLTKCAVQTSFELFTVNQNKDFSISTGCCISSVRNPLGSLPAVFASFVRGTVVVDDGSLLPGDWCLTKQGIFFSEQCALCMLSEQQCVFLLNNQ